MLSLRSIRRRLAARRPEPRIEADVRQAAVAVVLREVRGAVEALFIQRAERRGDPWSGQMAFPGGHLDEEDADLCAAAVRETREEIGLDLAPTSLLGELPRQRPLSVRRRMVVAPFVFAIEGDPACAPNHEVAAVVWAPLAPMHRGESVGRESPLRPADGASFSGFRLPGGHFVWGMTYRMVQTLFETIDPAYRRAAD